MKKKLKIRSITVKESVAKCVFVKASNVAAKSYSANAVVAVLMKTQGGILRNKK